MSKQLAAKVSISRLQGGSHENAVRIEITDASSGCRLLELEMQPKAFAEAITGIGYTDATMEFFNECPVGKRREVKTEVIAVPKGLRYTSSSEQRRIVAGHLLEPYEVNGWRGDIDDLFNQHRHTAAGNEVSFTRYVAANSARAEVELPQKAAPNSVVVELN